MSHEFLILVIVLVLINVVLQNWEKFAELGAKKILRS